MKTNGRKQISYNKPVGIIDGTLYLVNYTFEDALHGNPFKGVTGSILEPITQGQIDEYNAPENAKDWCHDLWKESVNAGRYEGSLDDFVDEMLECLDGEYLGHDPSDVRFVPDKIKEKYFPDAVTFNCVGGGRCFNKGMKWDVVLDEKLVKEIDRLELTKEDEDKIRKSQERGE